LFAANKATNLQNGMANNLPSTHTRLGLFADVVIVVVVVVVVVIIRHV
jgi:hypothetical protein